MNTLLIPFAIEVILIFAVLGVTAATCDDGTHKRQKSRHHDATASSFFADAA